ncbi:glycosyltransferase [bacterium]|nr:glycosyltransferase [bacterium]
MIVHSTLPKLILLVPVYNEEAVLPVTSQEFLEKLHALIKARKVALDSQLWYINDGSSDKTWEIIADLANKNPEVTGLDLSKNYGHQAALLAGLLEARTQTDITISLDCDGQDDISAIDEMLAAYQQGFEIVYGVRDDRQTDTWFKRTTAQGFYRLLKILGVEIIPNHADFRLVSARVLQHLADFGEVNIFLRGLFPLVGFSSTQVYYHRRERQAGTSHYPLRKMLHLAWDGITSLSIKPIRAITVFGFLVAFLSFIGVMWSVIIFFLGRAVSGWASMTSIICFLGGIQLVGIGILGEYIGKIYLETKRRPRYIVQGAVGQIRTVPVDAGANDDSGGQKGGQKSLSTLERVFLMIVDNPQVTRAEMAQKLGINPSAVEKHIDKLKAAGMIERFGGDRGGCWAVKNRYNDDERC